MQSEEKIMELNGFVKNTSITEYVFSKNRISLRAFNTVPHLRQKELVTYV